jgi:tetratricopeptide (TPR) repeat protein
VYCKWLPVALLAPLFTACHSNSAKPAVERLAILRFENLSGDASLDWAGRAFSEILTTELAGAASRQMILPVRMHAFDRALGVRPISAPGISTESTQAQAAGATVLGYGTYGVRNGKLEASLTLEDVSGMKTQRVITAAASADDVLGAATALAAQLTPKPASYGTRNPQALAGLMKALEATDPAMMEAAAGVAIAADPNFVGPYRLLARARLQRQDRAGAMAVLERALERGSKISDLDRARVELESSEVSGDQAARQNALAKIVKLEPGDAVSWTALSEILMARHEFKGAQEAFQRASALQPEEGLPLNSIGYAAAEAGDFDTGMKALRRYRELRPNEVDAIDSMGDINFIHGRLSEAENLYLEAAKKNPAYLNNLELVKAAMAHLLTGDAAGANNLAEQYLRARAEAKDPILELRRAEWTWISGRRKLAAQQMGAFALAAESGPVRDIASRGYAEMANWSLMSGDREMAMRLAQKSLSLAGPTAVVNALVARFLAGPPAPVAEWTLRAQQQFPGPAAGPVRDLALIYAFLINRQFQPAQALLRPMWTKGIPGADEGLPVLLAWADLETGDVKEAAELLRYNPVPSSAGLTPYTTFYIPRLLYLRGLLAEKESRRDEARGWYDKFLALSGPNPLIWGEEKKALWGEDKKVRQ